MKSLVRSCFFCVAMGLLAAAAIPAMGAAVEPVWSLAQKEKAPLLDTLKQLCEIESGSSDRAGLDRIAEVIAKRLAALGGKVEFIEPGPDTHRDSRTPEKVGRMVKATFTGTGAKKILIGSFLNLRATANWLKQECPLHLILVCSGTLEQAALEDTLAAGAVCERIWPNFAGGQADSAEIARRIYPLMQHDLYGAMKSSRNGRRLLANRELCADVRFCTQRETLAFVAGLDPDGVIRKWASPTASSSAELMHQAPEGE